MTEQETQIKEISDLDLAIVELNLYIDTHPSDLEVKKKHEEYIKKRNVLRKNLERNFLL